MHAGMVGKYVIEKLAKVPVIVDIASEFRYRDPLITDKDLVIIISQSGETADSLAAMRLAKELGAKTLAVVNAKGSSIAREADMLIYTHAGPEIAVASTKAYMVQIAVMYLLAFELALAVGEIDESECRRLTELLQKTPELIEQILENKEETQYIASSLITADSLLYIGRGLDYALSMEGSLKLKEISYIHSESYAAGELKHGTISLISDGMPVIAVATQQKLFEKTVSNIKEDYECIVLTSEKNLKESCVAEIPLEFYTHGNVTETLIMAVNTIYNPDVLIIQTDKNIFESNSLIDFEVFDKKGWNVKTRMEQMQFENCYNAYKWIIMQLLDD